MIALFNVLLVFIIILFMAAVGLDYAEQNLTLKTWLTGFGTVAVFIMRVTL